MYYIYLITNKVNNKTYVGQRKCPANKFPEQDISYMGSGVYLKNAQEKCVDILLELKQEVLLE